MTGPEITTMMGMLSGQEPLFFGFQLEDHVPPDHLLRRVDAVLDFGFVRRALAPYYSSTGRPSVDPELMLRMLLIGYLHGIRSERRLCDEVHLNLAYRWFCRLGLDGSVPDHSTFSKNRHGRFHDGDVHRLLFEEVVRACTKAGLVAGRDTAIDASTIEADAGCERKFTGAASADAWDEQERQARPVRDYLAALDAALPAAPDEREPAPPKYTSPTDPQAAWSIKHGPGRFSYATNYLIDSETSVILDVEATPARLGAEVAATRTLITRAANRFGFHPERLAADKAYGSAGLLRWLFERGIEPHVPLLDRTALTQGKLPRSAFAYDETTDAYTCPEGHQLRHRGYERRTRTHRYSGSPTTCGACPRKPDCTDAPTRRVLRMADEDVRDRVRDLEGTPAFARSRRLRKRVERLFGQLKRNMGLRRLKLRGLRGVAEEFTMAAAAQNLILLTRRQAPA